MNQQDEWDNAHEDVSSSFSAGAPAGQDQAQTGTDIPVPQDLAQAGHDTNEPGDDSPESLDEDISQGANREDIDPNDSITRPAVDSIDKEENGAD